MEGATASFWKRNLFEDLFDDRELNASVFLEPGPSVASSAELAINPFQNTTDTNRKRKVSGATRDAAAEKKRLIDKAYRERCKEMKKKTETKLDALTKENDGLRRENSNLKNEGMLLLQTLQRQKDGMKQLEKEFGQIKSQLHRQNTVVEVLSKRLGGSDDKDLQLENAQLKHNINLLTRKINNPESLSVIQLRAKIALLENEKHSLQVIVDALCEKINNEKDQLGLQN
ncbi:PREDICTED: puff II/9-2 protein-like isoform X1 [Populus euphratica]|uniref:Puff II/9-2 protein-like isoform X1 n=1 Tax=Populus euphratica TaxID=75702 RepID=A0AAJ6UB73_POPEU|nr:PREDICTED: puff II/9-2 protein-like isoform X1 [Populus euphratica]XP_011026673.1 PREDICTED: puff II/9-2 protein-like isoform X1 [Populus euphratica]